MNKFVSMVVTFSVISVFLLNTFGEIVVNKNDVSKVQESGKSLLVYIGAASKPPSEEIIKEFEKETGIRVEAIFGGSGYIMSQMKLTKRGDIYFPGSSDYMEIAKREKLVYPASEKQVVYLVNAINVQKGNPKKIYSLKDLCRPGLKIAIANPEGVCVGSYAVEIIEKNLSATQKKLLKENLINYTESCDKTASAIALKTVDAVIGWSVFQYWNPEQIETIPLSKDEIVRIGYIPIAVSIYSKNPELAQKFINFVVGKKGKEIFGKYNYFATANDAQMYVGAKKPVGGEYIVPSGWINK